jgi:hypothetical protein
VRVERSGSTVSRLQLFPDRSAFRRLRTKVGNVGNGLHDTSTTRLALGHQFLR